jgi:hypothetical protein
MFFFYLDVKKRVISDNWDTAVQLPRPNRNGGTLALIHKSSFEAKRLPETNHDVGECMNLLFCFWTQCVRLLIIYRPPPSPPSRFVNEFSLTMEAVCSTRDKLVAIGDFNFHVELACNTVAQTFLGLMEAFGLTQCVASPTHIKGHTLDLVFTQHIDNLVSQTCVSSLRSDHYAIQCCLAIRTPRWLIDRTFFRSFKSIDSDLFVANLISLDLFTGYYYRWSH